MGLGPAVRKGRTGPPPTRESDVWATSSIANRHATYKTRLWAEA